jgi:hypothetical protein
MAIANITNNILTDSGTTIASLQPLLTNPVTGTGTSNYLPKFTGASTIGNSLIYDNGTNVGIGTTSPSFLLDVNGAARISNLLSVYANLTSAIISYGVDNNFSTRVIGGSGYNASFGLEVQAGTSSSDTAFQVSSYSGGTNFIRITGAGNIGMGTATPNHLLTINNNSNSGTYFGLYNSYSIDSNDWRNWVIATNNQSFGDFNIIQSNAKGGNPVSAGTSRLYISNGGNVGIGNINNTYKLDVSGTGRFTSNVGIGYAPNTWFSGYVALEMGSGSLVYPANATNTQLWNNLYVNAAGNTIYKSTGIGGLFSLGGGGNAAVWYSAASGTAGTTASLSQIMTLTNGGNLGIGLTNPDAKLFVKGAGGAQLLIDYQGNPTNYYDADTHIFRSYSGNTYPERMRIKSTGNVIINNTSDNGAKFQVKGQSATGDDFAVIITDSNNTTSFGVRNDKLINTPGVYGYAYASTANVFVQSDGFLGRNTSSLKYKKNVEDYSRGLKDVLKLRPVLYESKNPTEANKKFTGFIAEEIDTIGLTEFVQYAEDGTPDALMYPHFVALLAKAIQEQNVLIQEQNVLIQDLTERLSILENK